MILSNLRLILANRKSVHCFTFIGLRDECNKRKKLQIITCTQILGIALFCLHQIKCQNSSTNWKLSIKPNKRESELIMSTHPLALYYSTINFIFLIVKIYILERQKSVQTQILGFISASETCIFTQTMSAVMWR